MVAVQGEVSDFRGFVCVYNILMLIHQRIKGEQTIKEVMKYKKDLARMNMSEDEEITVYTFQVVFPSLFDKNSRTKSGIS